MLENIPRWTLILVFRNSLENLCLIHSSGKETLTLTKCLILKVIFCSSVCMCLLTVTKNLLKLHHWALLVFPPQTKFIVPPSSRESSPHCVLATELFMVCCCISRLSCTSVASHMLATLALVVAKVTSNDVTAQCSPTASPLAAQPWLMLKLQARVSFR